MVEILYFKNVTSAKLSALRSTNCLFLKSTIKYLSNDGSIFLTGHAVHVYVKIYGHFFFLTKFIKIIMSFHKNADVITKIIPQNKFSYGTVY